jgi:hypothetical protein
MVRRAAAVFTAVFVVLCAVSAHAQNPPTSGGVWLKGDLHAHSNQSDGINSVSDHISKAESLGFDYYVITDHDNSPLTQGYPAQWYHSAYVSNTVHLLYGMEWTTADGHANVWKDVTFDYSAIWAANQANDADDAQIEANSEGALFSINHPEEVGHEWLHAINYIPNSVEVWQLPFLMADLNTFQGYPFYDGLLRSGYRVPAVGGSDTHTLTTAWWWLFGSKHKYSGLGKPTTWVYAQEDSGAGVIAAILSGRASISYAPTGPRLELRADSDNDGQYDDALMGDNLPISAQSVAYEAKVVGNAGGGSVIDLSAHVPNLLNGTVTFANMKGWLAQNGYSSYDLLLAYKDGVLFRFVALVNGADTYTFSDSASTQAYYRVELHRIPTPNPGGGSYADGVTAITNPIYIGY